MIKGVTENDQNIIESILKEYKNKYDFYYYGSRVKGTFERTSDLDILIKGNEKMPLSILNELKDKFDKSRLSYVVNFSDYNTITEDFYNIIKQDLVLA